MKKIKLVKLILSKEEFNKLDKKKKKRYLMFTCIIRDLNLLQKCLGYTSNEKPTNEVHISANATISFFFLKMLLSKIYEMWSFIQKNKVFDDYSNFSEELKNATDKTRNFFSDKKIENLFSFIRNKFGFHYEYWEDVDELIDNAMQSFPSLEIWLSSENSANEIFASSNGIILKVIFTEMLKEGFSGDDKMLLGILFHLTLDGAKIFGEFSTYYLAEVFQIKWEQKEEHEIDAPLMTDVVLPLLVAK